jgi:hypothetical protein
MSQSTESEVFYILDKQRDVSLDYKFLIDSSASRWFVLVVDAATDQQAFVHLLLTKGEMSSGKIQYALWHFKSDASKRIGASLVEYNPPDKDFNPARVTDR